MTQKKILTVSTNVVCACGRTRQIQVEAGDFQETRIAKEPCTCGRLMCKTQTQQSIIDLMMDE